MRSWRARSAAPRRPTSSPCRSTTRRATPSSPSSRRSSSTCTPPPPLLPPPPPLPPPLPRPPPPSPSPASAAASRSKLAGLGWLARLHGAQFPSVSIPSADPIYNQSNRRPPAWRLPQSACGVLLVCC
uniref:Uncharacterized protein n=1 Tax=Zea mays TaxID=4577 RepID=B4FT04_MAIZE|nr:unknown [Zea mays]